MGYTDMSIRPCISTELPLEPSSLESPGAIEGETGKQVGYHWIYGRSSPRISQ